MQLKASITGNLQKIIDDEFKAAERAITKGISEATLQLKNTMRQQVKSSKLGSRLANTWRGDIYPKGKQSISAAGVVYTKAEKIMQSFEYGKIIRGKDGFWLAIPTPAIPKRLAGKKITPAIYERIKGARLRFVYRPNGTSLLVHEQKRKTVIAFWLVQQAKMPKLISFERESQKIEKILPTLILNNWSDNE